MTEKKSNASPQKAERLSTDAYPEDYALVEKLKEEMNLDSRKEALHVLCNRYRDNGDDSESTESENTSCDFLIQGSSLALHCAKNYEKPKKTTVEKCRICLKAQKIEKQQNERAEIRSWRSYEV